MGWEKSLAQLGEEHIYLRSHCQKLGRILGMMPVCWGCVWVYEIQLLNISWITSGPQAQGGAVIVCVSIFATGSQEVQSFFAIFFF